MLSSRFQFIKSLIAFVVYNSVSYAHASITDLQPLYIVYSAFIANFYRLRYLRHPGLFRFHLYSSGYSAHLSGSRQSFGYPPELHPFFKCLKQQ